LDNEFIIQQFDAIEKRVETVVEFCKTLETTNAALRDKIKALELELQAKTDSEHRQDDVKALIRSKIDNLMSRLENITEMQE
jgi:hypothetical protein